MEYCFITFIWGFAVFFALYRKKQKQYEKYDVEYHNLISERFEIYFERASNERSL